MAINTKAIPANAVLQVTPKGALYTGNTGSMHNTALTWASVQAHLKANPNTTRAQLFTHLQSTRNHACFVAYALGRGWLAPKVAATTVKAK